MATADVTEQSPLDVIREEIIKVFERILSEVRARRDELLEQVSKMKREFETKNISIVESMKELKEMRTQVEKMSVKQNLAMKKQQESLADIDSEIEKLKIDLNYNSKFKFNYSIDQLIEQVTHFGKVIDESCVISEYQSKLTAVKVINEHQNFYFGQSSKLHIDPYKQLLYVLNSFQKGTESIGDEFSIPLEIAVFCTKDFAFITHFGKNGCHSDSIATSKEFVYVGQREYTSIFGTYQIVQYTNSDYSIIQTLDTSSNGIFVTSENQIYLLSFSDQTFKFHIYDRALNFKEERNLCYQWTKSEPIILAKQRHELFYMVFNQKLLVFTQEGKNIHSIFHKEGWLLLLFLWL